MPKLVVHGAQLSCSCGTAPASLTVLPNEKTSTDEKPVATVDDYKPMVNVAPFGMCTTQSNPQVAAATSAAQGVLTPQPCVPVTTQRWSPGSTVATISDVPVLTSDSTASCQWSGSISIKDPGSEVDVD
ncbi:MAG TPA: DUF4280 domain-containing protein [Polyangiaceae bacterium]|jgi:hypothetical protein|nr:DUF4280 domain-containing protein [Polyangiaceae bacterium]